MNWCPTILPNNHGLEFHYGHQDIVQTNDDCWTFKNKLLCRRHFRCGAVLVTWWSLWRHDMETFSAFVRVTNKHFSFLFLKQVQILPLKLNSSIIRTPVVRYPAWNKVSNGQTVTIGLANVLVPNRWWYIPSLVQIMHCRLFGDNPLSEPMMVYFQLDPKEHISMKFYLKFRSFHEKMHRNMSSAKMAAILCRHQWVYTVVDAYNRTRPQNYQAQEIGKVTTVCTSNEYCNSMFWVLLIILHGNDKQFSWWAIFLSGLVSQAALLFEMYAFHVKKVISRVSCQKGPISHA